MTINCSLGGFAAHMLAAGADMKLAEEAVLEKACVMVRTLQPPPPPSESAAPEKAYRAN
jgi:hypothetical protein